MAADNRIATPSIFAISILSGFFLAAVTCRAQETPPPANEYVIGTDNESSNAALFRAINGQPSPVGSASADPPQADTTGLDTGWHFAVAPYLWFPGVHGIATGPAGRGLSFRASPGDLLSHFRFGLMAGGEATRKRLVLTGDVVWVRLQDDKSVPFPGLGASSATMKASELLLTPKIGLALVNQEKIKIMALTGMRYWHLGESLNFNPSLLGLNFNGSQNFVDPLVGGRIEASPSQRVVVNILGDVGGWGTGSQLEYQWAGTLGYRVNARWALHAGYRYLYVDKNASRGVVFKATTAGVVFGITLDLK